MSARLAAPSLPSSPPGSATCVRTPRVTGACHTQLRALHRECLAAIAMPATQSNADTSHSTTHGQTARARVVLRNEDAPLLDASVGEDSLLSAHVHEGVERDGVGPQPRFLHRRDDLTPPFFSASQPPRCSTL
eukprot:3869574-Rhodomonas_salina.2